MTVPRRTVRTWSVVLLMTALSGCGDDSLLKPVEAWLNCDECINGERAAVRALGETAVPQLVRALLEGPPAAHRELIRQQGLAMYSKGGLDSLSANRYSTQLVDNYVANYQARAAVSLGDIRTVRAISALDDALRPPRSLQYRSDVLRNIRFARTAIDATPFGGRFARRMVDFGDTAFLLAPPARPFAATDVVALDDTTFSPADVLISRQPSRVAFTAVGLPGSHMVEVRSLGAGTIEIAELVITTIADANDRVMQKCPDRACEVTRSPIIPAAALPYKSFLSLWSADRDSFDMFRFIPTSPLTVTAQLDWSGPANLDLLWRRCTPFTPVGNTDGATAAKPERTTETIPAGECWLLFVALGSQLPQPTLARIRVTSP
jgi:hypothetical protein